MKAFAPPPPAPPSSPPRPLYQQVKDGILQRIRAGHWSPGKQIPSENQLVRELAMSRMTIHRALRELAQEGHVHRVAGVGTFVAEPPRHARLIELRNIADEVRAHGGEHRSQLCQLERQVVGEKVARWLEVDPRAEAFHIVLVHFHDELPIQLEDRWVDPQLVPDFLAVDFRTTTPAEHLLRTIRPHEMEHIVQAVLPDAATAQLLAMASAEPCLRLERRTWHEGRVVTYAALTYPGSRYDLGAHYALEQEGAPDGASARRFTASPGGGPRFGLRGSTEDETPSRSKP